MSTYSQEIKQILDNSLIVKMTKLADDILRREPYSIDDEKLLNDKRELSRLTNIYDFLSEYIDGYEEFDDMALYDIVRLAGSIQSIEEDFEPTLIETTDRLVSVWVDGNIGWNGYIKYGLHDVKLRYNGEADHVQLVHDQGIIQAQGSTVEGERLLIDGDGAFELRAFDKDNVLIATILIKYKADNLLSGYPNAITDEGTAGLPVTLVLP